MSVPATAAVPSVYAGGGIGLVQPQRVLEMMEDLHSDKYDNDGKLVIAQIRRMNMQAPDLPPNANDGSATTEVTATVATAMAAVPPQFRHLPEVCGDDGSRPPLPANAISEPPS